MIKVAFFDIDGTLLPFGASRLSNDCARALNALQKNGVKLVIATGRPLSVVPVFDNVRFDGILCFNGQMFFANDECVFQIPMDPQEVEQVIANARQAGYGVCLATENGMAINFANANLRRYVNNDSLVDLARFEQMRQERVYQILVGMHYDDAPVLLPATRQTKVTYWCDYGLDVIPKDGGKDQGLLRVAHHFGAEPSETIAFGDGLNDLDMLRKAGIGVAMGNAMEGLKNAADYVTRTVEEEGVAFALRHFGLLPD